MNQQLKSLRFSALVFLVPGLAGLLTAAAVATHYLDTLPRWPQGGEQARYVPRGIHGIVVYLTKDEDRRLSVIEDTSAFSLLVGTGFGLVYLRRWGIADAIAAGEDDLGEDAKAEPEPRPAEKAES